MGCSNCATGDGKPAGCGSNGSCGTSGCNKLNVFDWLSDMQLPEGQEPFKYVEVRFKNGRKEIFHNADNIALRMGDTVAVQAKNGHDIGMVSLTGELVRIQMKKNRVRSEDPDILKIYRIATQRDIDIWQSCREREPKIQVSAREIAIKLKLRMKISDVEFQGDGTKIVFYYTAESRVDFRQLIREYAREFNSRIEMKQIGLRQEASRLGGVGSCGRELCCSTWLTDFRSVSTSAARYQNLSLNPQKLAGQCGKLKCCLNYELDSYMDALKKFPRQNRKLYTEKGTAVCQKIDIFKGVMWYCYEGEWMNWHKLNTEDVHKIIDVNEKRDKVKSLEDFAVVEKETDDNSFENVVGQDSLTRFDNKKSSNKRKNRRKKSNSSNRRQKGGKAKGSPNDSNK